MILLSAVDFKALLIASCVLCAVLVCANVAVALLIARRTNNNVKIMKRDVYTHKNDGLSDDCDKYADSTNTDNDSSASKDEQSDTEEQADFGDVFVSAEDQSADGHTEENGR